MTIVPPASITAHLALPFQAGPERVCLDHGSRASEGTGRSSLGKRPRLPELSRPIQGDRPDPNSA